MTIIKIILISVENFFLAKRPGTVDLMEKIAGTTGTMLGGLQNLGVGLMTNGFTMISLTTQRPLAIVLTLATAIVTILALIIYRVTTKKSHDSLNIQKTYY